MAASRKTHHAGLRRGGSGRSLGKMFSFWRPALYLALTAGALVQLGGCTRPFYRKRVDKEVEEVLATHPAVAEVGVAGVLDDTRGEAVTYHPERLSMERSATAFTAADRVGQLAVQINDIDDSRRMLAEQRRLRSLPSSPPPDPLELGS